MLWLGLHFIDLQLHHQARTLEQAPPLALVGGQPIQVLQLNSLARDAGVARGQSLATATSLCPELRLLEPMADDGPLLEELGAWAYGFSGRVVLVPPDRLLLEAGSMLRLFGGLAQWRAALNLSLETLGLPCRQGLGHTPQAAALLARSGEDGNTLEEEALRASLLALPVAALELPGDSGERLLGMGIRQAEQLYRLPRQELGQRFGSELLLYLSRLWGELPDPRQEYQPPPGFRQKLVLMEEVELAQVLLFPLKRMLAALGEFLRHRQLSCDAFTLTLVHRQGPDQVIVLRPGFAEHRSEQLFKLVQLRFERLTLYQPVVELVVSAERFSELDPDARTLSAQVLPGGEHNPAWELVSQLIARLGESRVRGVGCVDEIRPERAWCWGEPGALGSAAPHKPRPPWLLESPQEIERSQLQLRQGPERLESGWWDGAPVARDYYLAQVDDGRWCWAYRDELGWFIHGWF
ncbi:DNA polymerase Y family protein [Ferrimonas sp. YFM]|uniref:Y-family DNA polymerase n=1 Tax=Ferrimonas sp. YFM TaxID=3028878 RepID=UPI002572BB6A|nr:DNA polymerase Y family protein [Ferrimonas sp. YFM]BDY05295.1 DNA repair nucleotidyltransferase [Ferrimonas sp. YFM]